MTPHIRAGVICFILITFLTAIGLAVESPANVLYIQSGESSVIEDVTGGYLVTVRDVIPYLHITDGTNGTSLLKPIDKLDTAPYPLNAALVFRGEDSVSSFIVDVSNVSLSLEDKTITLQVIPLDFYDGNVLKPFVRENEGFITDMAGKSRITGMYLEMFNYPPQNAHYPIFDP